MNILVTGAKGFIGRNLVAELANRPETTVFAHDLDSDPAALDRFCREAAFVFHLAGVNRPREEAEFMSGNAGLTGELLATLSRHENNCPVMLASSTQAALDNPYGRSKQAGEALVFAHGRATGARVLVYRFPNVFGKWCRPNYNSAVATFCHNIARDRPVTVRDPKASLTLAYIDDVLAELTGALAGRETRDGAFCRVPVTHTATLGEIVARLEAFRDSRRARTVPDLADPFTRKLYATWLSGLPRDRFSYRLEMKSDERGSFTEFLRTPERGQVAVNVAAPGVVKGNHWHHTKVEKFLVVRGEAVIRFRPVDRETVTEYRVSGRRLEVVDIPAGYTHNIENTGDGELVTVMWASEAFDPERPDTYFLPV